MAILNTKYLKKEMQERSVADTIIAEIIENNTIEDFSEQLKQCNNWEVFSELSELRTSILNWYEFRESSDVLEIGGGYGALTGTLCNRCATVTVTEPSLFKAKAICKRYKTRDNLEVYAGELSDLEFEKTFDYIILIGGLEKVGNGSSEKDIYSNYLQLLKRLVKPHGKILMAIENRYGIRYFCGAPEYYTGKPFEGINHYSRGTTGYTFHKQEIIDIIQKAGIGHYKFYYPLPDYKFTQLVYTDEYLPDRNLQERLLPYYSVSNTLIALEGELYNDLLDNEVFPFFSNSFFVECSLQREFCSVIYAAVSTDRGKERAFSTTIHNNSVVKKKVLYQEGEKNLQQLFRNMQDLKGHNIPVISHSLNKKTVLMDYIKQPTLSNYLRELIKTDVNHYITIFDQIYEMILNSSKHISNSKNALYHKDITDSEWGIILEKAYLELIPLNCFYNNGNFLFFDQEFVKEQYPAKYVLFRAIHYMYAFAPFAEEILSIEVLKERYQLKKVWGCFLEEEHSFLTDVRRMDIYPLFYSKLYVDRRNLGYNSDALLYNTSDHSAYITMDRMKRVQKTQVDLLSILQGICDKHKLKYYVIYGTLLGAVRHKGIIPWDDDVDIVLPRRDYNRLLELANTELVEPYFLQTPDNDQGCFYGGYSKLRNGNTTGIEIMNWGHNCNHGIWIDIFPLDLCYEKEHRDNKKIHNVTFYQRLLFAKTYSSEKSFRDMKIWQWKLYCALGLFFSRERLYRKLDKELAECKDKDTKFCAIYTHYNGGKALKKFFREDFEASIIMKFEHLLVPVPKGYERILQMTIGNDYMTYPSQEDRKPRHEAFFAPNVPYKTYVTRFMDCFNNTSKKTIVLFGSGLMYEDYMDKYGEKYAPIYLVDNDQKKWGTKKLGVLIKDPDELKHVDKSDLHLIICSIYFRQIETQIRQMGITKYYIYVQEKKWIIEDTL